MFCSAADSPSFSIYLSFLPSFLSVSIDVTALCSPEQGQKAQRLLVLTLAWGGTSKGHET